MPTPHPREWTVTGVHLSGVGAGNLGELGLEGSVILAWTAALPTGEAAGFGELTLQFMEGKWQMQTETLGSEFAGKVLAFLAANATVVE